MTDVELYESVSPMITKKSFEWHLKTGFPVDDFKSLANTIFCIALSKYNKNKNTKFSTFFYDMLEKRFTSYIRKEFRHRNLSVSTDTHLIEDIMSVMSSDIPSMDETVAHNERLGRLNSYNRRLIDLWLADSNYVKISEKLGIEKSKIRRDIMRVFDSLKSFEMA